MESKRVLLDLADTPTGTKVSFYFHQLVAETEDEMECLADIRKAAACDDVDESGSPTITYQPVIVAEPPFNGRVLFPLVRDCQKEQIEMWSPQAYDLMIERKFGSCQSGYPIISEGLLNGRPNLSLWTTDQKRAIVVVSRRRTLRKLLGKLFHQNRVIAESLSNRNSASKVLFPVIEKVNLPSPRFHGDDAELLIIEAKSIARVKVCLNKYGRYLDDDESEKLFPALQHHQGKK
jgi:hypothetical protein